MGTPTAATKVKTAKVAQNKGRDCVSSPAATIIAVEPKTAAT
jgi:hypothetical protein